MTAKTQTPATAYQLKYNRSSVHIAGIAERTQVSSDGMDYALSACPTLSRSVNFVTKNGSDDLAEALNQARLTASSLGLKVCQHCEKAAEKQIAELAEAAKPVETLATATAVRLLEVLAANPGRWFRPREIERLWGLKNDGNIRSTARRMTSVQTSTDEQGAMIFALAA